MARPTDHEALQAAVDAVNQCDGNRSDAARLLNLDRECVRRRIDRAIQLGMKVKPPNLQRRPPNRTEPADLPTPIQIRRRCRRIRKAWGPSTEESRRKWDVDLTSWNIPEPGQRFTELVEAAE